MYSGVQDLRPLPQNGFHLHPSDKDPSGCGSCDGSKGGGDVILGSNVTPLRSCVAVNNMFISYLQAGVNLKNEIKWAHSTNLYCLAKGLLLKSRHFP